MSESQVVEAMTRLDKATKQVRQCVLISLASDHPDILIEAIERFEDYLARHPEMAA